MRFTTYARQSGSAPTSAVSIPSGSCRRAREGTMGKWTREQHRNFKRTMATKRAAKKEAEKLKRMQARAETAGRRARPPDLPVVELREPPFPSSLVNAIEFGFLC